MPKIADRLKSILAVRWCKTYGFDCVISYRLKRGAMRQEKSVSGLTYASATEQEITKINITALLAIYRKIDPAATVEAGPVTFGSKLWCAMPVDGFYIDGRRLSLPVLEKDEHDN